MTATSRAIYISLEGAVQAAESFKLGYQGRLDFVAPRAVYGKGGHILGWGVLFKPYFGQHDWTQE